MTTDSDEGRRQAEAAKPEPLKVGNKVRLRAGGNVMVVVALEDYGNQAVCEWRSLVGTDGQPGDFLMREPFPAASLVQAEPTNQW